MSIDTPLHVWPETVHGATLERRLHRDAVGDFYFTYRDLAEEGSPPRAWVSDRGRSAIWIVAAQRDSLAREVLRLAQREAYMEAAAAAWKKTAEACSDAAAKHLARIAELEEDGEGSAAYALEIMRKTRDALRAANLWRPREDGQGGTGDCAVAAIERLQDLEERLRQVQHRESLWKSSAEKTGEMVRKLEARTAALERENREKTLELAEKAGRIRELEEERDAFQITAEEGQEIIAELSAGLAIGHGEDLKPCISPCPGHLGPKASAACKQAAEAWRELEAERDALKLKGDKQIVLRDDLFRENSRLRAAIKDGIAHVEMARTGAVDAGPDLGENYWRADQIIEQLDLAHEALSGAVAGRSDSCSLRDRIQWVPNRANLTSPGAADDIRPGIIADVDGAGVPRPSRGLALLHGRLVALEGQIETLRAWGSRIDEETRTLLHEGEGSIKGRLLRLAERLAALEGDLGKLGAATNPVGKPPTSARLESLEESRCSHALMLTDHADRLRAVEQALRVDGESNLTWHPFFRNGIAKLEKLVSRVVEDLEGLKARISAGNNAAEQAGKE